MQPIRIGNAPCSWGSLEFEGLAGEAIDSQQMLNELCDTGYAGTELGDWGYLPTDPAVLRDELARRTLTLTGAFVPVDLRRREAHAAGEAQAVLVARQLAAVSGTTLPFLVLADANGANADRTREAGRITPALALNDDEWAIFASGAERVANAVRATGGLRTVFHHHCAGYVETPDEIARLLQQTNPDLLGLVFDTGHYLYGTGQNDGMAVIEGLKRFGDRIWYMHFKDCQPQVAARARAERWDYFTAIGNGVFCELGRGGVDFAAVAAWLRQRGYQGWITVEQDVLPGMGAPRASAQRSREFLRTLGL